VWKGRFFRLDEHIQRFMASVKSLRLDLGFGPDELTDILHGVVSRGGLRDSYVSMTCTRGRPAPGSRDLRTCRNSFYCFAIPFVWISSPEQQATGTHMWISDMPRIPPESVDPAVKNYHWLDLDMALLDAYDRDAQMVVLRDLSGAITEGAGYNVFAFVDGRWLTPDSGTLKGITRRTVIELCRESNVDVEEGQLLADDLRRADEVIVTSTAGGIMPVTRLEGRSIGDGRPGPRTTALRDAYWDAHDHGRWSTPVRYDAHE
jgi:branched-chain amino acid aminotransferase